MQINKKKIITISVIILIILIALVALIINVSSKKKRANEYYYEFKYDDNLITQSVWIYNGNGDLQTDYYMFYNDEPVSYTTGEKAVLTMVLLDLKDHPTFQIKFKSEVDELDKEAKSYDVKFKSE